MSHPIIVKPTDFNAENIKFAKPRSLKGEDGKKHIISCIRYENKPMATCEYKDVTFETPYKEKYDKDDEFNISPYISIYGGYEDDVFVGLRNPDEVVIPEHEIDIGFSYPLKAVFIFTFISDTEAGFTRKGLAKMVIKKYEEIYDEEEKTYTEKSASNYDAMYGEAHPSAVRLIRGDTNGTYGISGSAIGALLLHKVSYNPDTEYWTLGIDS